MSIDDDSGRDEMGVLTLRLWLLLASSLLILKYAGICVSAMATSRLDNLLGGVWITSKLFDMSINFIFFIMFGWGIAAGTDDGNLFAGNSQFFATGLADDAGGWPAVFLVYMLSAVFLIVVAESMRADLLPLNLPYQIMTLVITCIIFPILLHWGWSDHGWASPYRSTNFDGLLFGCGVLDATGSGIVHLGAGITALAFSVATASDTTFIEKFIMDELHAEGMGVGIEEEKDKAALKKLREFREGTQNTYNQSVGVLCMWLGTYGMMIINMPVDEENAANSVATRAINVTMAAAAAALTAVLIQASHIAQLARSNNDVDSAVASSSDKGMGDDSSSHEQQHNSVKHKSGIMQSSDASIVLGCVSTALVSIAGSMATCEVGGAAAIGAVAAVLHCVTKAMQKYLSLTMTSGAFSHHFIGGMWGLLSPGFFTSKTHYASLMGTAFSASDLGGVINKGTLYTQYSAATDTVSLTTTSRSEYCAGLFYGGSGAQLGANVTFGLAVLSWCMVITFVVVKILKLSYPEDFKAVEKIISEEDQKQIAEIKQDERSWLYKKLFSEDTEMVSPRSELRIKEQRAQENLDSQLKHQQLLGMPEQILKADEVFFAKFGYSWDAVMVFPLHGSLLRDRKAALNMHKSTNTKLPRDEGGDGGRKGSIVSLTHHLMEGTVETVDSDVPSAVDIIKNLRHHGLETVQFYSSNFDSIFCKVRAPLHVLRRRADLMNLPIKLDAEQLKKACNMGFEGNHGGKYVKIKGFNIYNGMKEKVTSIQPYDHIWAPMDDIILNSPATTDIYEKAPGLNHEFGSINRLRVIDDIVRSMNVHKHNSDGTDEGKYDQNKNEEDGAAAGDSSSDEEGTDEKEALKGGNDAGLDKPWYSFYNLMTPPDSDTKKQGILAWFPLHNQNDIEALRNMVFSVSVMPGKEPPDDLRDYLGAEVGLYFKFLTHYIKYLVPVAVLGLGASAQVYINWASYDDYFDAVNGSYSVPAFAFLVCVWAGVFIRSWAAEEMYNALRWGTTEYEETEQELPSYVGKKGKSYIDGSVTTLVNREAQNSRQRVSTLVITTLSLLVVGVIAATFYLKFYLITNGMSDYSITADVINAVSIGILDTVYKGVATRMTAYENHRTQTDYNDALIVKLFLFSFANSYAPAIYIAFMKKLINDQCLADSCMGELAQSMAVIFTIRSMLLHVMTFIVPRATKVKNRILAWWSKQLNPDAMEVASLGVETKSEKEYRRPEFDNVFSDYNELSVQFGFLCLFSAAFPIAPIFAIINNFVEVRSDGLKLLLSFRRPWPQGAEDIGSWYTIFDIIGVLSIFSNALIIAWTMDITTDATNRLYIFIGFVLVSLLGRYITSQALKSKRLEEVQIQISRQGHIIKKVIDRVPDEFEYSEETTGTGKSRKNEDYYSSSSHLLFSSVDETDIIVLEESKKEN